MENKWGKGGLIFTDPETQVPTNDATKALHQKAREEHVKTWGSRKVDVNKTRALPMTIPILCRTVVKGKRQNQHKHKASVSKQLRSDQQLQSPNIRLHFYFHLCQQVHFHKIKCNSWAPPMQAPLIMVTGGVLEDKGGLPQKYFTRSIFICIKVILNRNSANS